MDADVKSALLIWRNEKAVLEERILVRIHWALLAVTLVTAAVGAHYVRTQREQAQALNSTTMEAIAAQQARIELLKSMCGRVPA